jgi:hypothetical protein
MMTLPVAGYIQAANIQDESVRYEWDDWREIPDAQTVDEELLARLEGISERAVLAFMCATAEWIVYRFSRLLDNPAPFAYLEAAWAMTVDVHYGEAGGAIGWEKYTYQSNEWVGPIKKPIGDALLRLEIAIQLLAQDGTDPVDRAVLLAALANHVMTDPAPYEQWCGQVLDRFESLYPLDSEDELGDVVPRQAANPAFDFHVENTEVLVNEFLSSLDYRSNMFLSSPEGMLESEYTEVLFEGTPYVFSMDEDRHARREPKGHEGHKEHGDDESDQ